MLNWKTSKLLNDKYLVVGQWNFDKPTGINKVDYLGADTETKLYYNNELLTEDKAYNLYKENGQSWCRTHIEVRCYAFMIADADNFALFTNAEDFLTTISMLNTKCVFWYNARFDFAIFDYFFLTNEWKDVTEELKDNNRRHKFPDKTYQSLNGDFGQRYQMQIWKSYINRRYQKKVHKFKMVDICNITSGGLKKNLKDWDIVDRQGNPVRKLEMDYVQADIEQDLQYMINDTKGLYLLAEKIDNVMKDISSFSLFNGDYMTAGGLAKKTLLKYMFGSEKPKNNIKTFKICFPLTIDEDKDFRRWKLYLGGKCFVNPYKVGVVQQNVHKYDVNSMYPDKMRNMLYPFGKPKMLPDIPKVIDKTKCYIVKISNIIGHVKDNMLPIWQDSYTGDYKEYINEYECRYIWLEELREIEEWYDIVYDIDYVLEYTGKIPKGAKKFVDTFYEIKKTKSGAVKQCAKLLLNSSYGKISQKIERAICTYELAEDGVVHIVKKGVEIDENAMLSVVVGSRMTALSRVHLLSLIRETSKGDVKNNYCYCDTDSVHSLCAYEDTDPVELGKLKDEGCYDYALYLAPKSYLMWNKDGYEVHCKGVNTEVVRKEVEKCKTFKDACDVFRPNRTFKCLTSLNVKGGKALIYTDKMILNDETLGIDTRCLEDKIDEVVYDDDIY